MVGELVHNDVELGASPLFMTVERVPIIQYIAMPTPTGSRFIFRSPKLSYTDNVYLLPFDSLVWYCLVMLVLITATCLCFAVTLEWKYSLIGSKQVNGIKLFKYLGNKIFLKFQLQTDTDGNGSYLRPKIGDIILVIYGATCQQGTSVMPRSTTSRIIMIVAFTILMFLYTSYSANIVALLQSPSTRIKTLKDLYESRLEIGVDDTVFNRYYFTVNYIWPYLDTIYIIFGHYYRLACGWTDSKKYLWAKGLEEKWTRQFHGVRGRGETCPKGSMRLVNVGHIRLRLIFNQGLFAFHMELALGYKLMSETFFEDEKCGIREIAYLQVTDPWYAIRKNSSYKELFKIGQVQKMACEKKHTNKHTNNFHCRMFRMHEHGLQDRQNSRMYTKKPRCTGSGGNFITASLVDTKPAILVLLCGVFFAICLLAIELLVHRIQMKQKMNGTTSELIQ